MKATTASNSVPADGAPKWRRIFIAPVVVGALGYFVDIYDLTLFSVVRVPSLKGLGLEGQALMDSGVFLINMQMLGMLIGGLLWGMLGDKKGRLSVLFGSIALYSLANILNAFVTNVPQYAILRFVAGVGLAGELGAAITLVSESLPRDLRGYGTTIVATVGICGAVLGGMIAESFSWQISYVVGGVLGLLLLVSRISLHESGMFAHAQADQHVKKGDLKLLFGDRTRLVRYAQCVLIGVPVWYVVGILYTFSPELGPALGTTEPVTSAYAILWGYAGLAAGDLTSGLLSQWFRSRKKVVLIFLAFTSAATAAFILLRGLTPAEYYAMCFAIGVGVGYWALFVTIAAEQFGTNLRATVAISVPNFVRGFVLPLTLSFKTLAPRVGVLSAAAAIGAVTLAISFLALWKMRETYGRDLDYVETERTSS